MVTETSQTFHCRILSLQCVTVVKAAKSAWRTMGYIQPPVSGLLCDSIFLLQIHYIFSVL